MDNTKIGNFIAELRKQQNMTQQDLAQKLNITDKAVSRWETGKGLPDMQLLEPLAKELNVSVNELISGQRLSDNDIKDNRSLIFIIKYYISKIKKVYISMIIFLILLIMLIFYSISTFNTPNIFVGISSILKVNFTNNKVVEIKSYPKVIVAKSDNSNKELSKYMKERDFVLDEKSGNKLTFINKNKKYEKEVVSISNNGIYSVWKWYE